MENLENKGMKAFQRFIFEEARMRAISIFVKELEKVSKIKKNHKIILIIGS